jgi:uncharacterized caspase-like protein
MRLASVWHLIRPLIISAFAILCAGKTPIYAQQQTPPFQSRFFFQTPAPTSTHPSPASAPLEASGPGVARLALVIGNGKYKELPKLTNPETDARAIFDALRDLGFDVTLVTDASGEIIRRAVSEFAHRSGQADLALVYYAGHGAQVNAENYLLPVDMEIPRTEADIELLSLKVDDLVNSIRSTTKIVFLDACRDNPALFKNLVKGRGAIAAGLGPTDASQLTRIKPGGGVFIAYATDAGSVALEGEGEHSPFTQALLRNLKKPISIDDMFSLVTREVALVTKGTQRPYKYASLENIICLTGTCSGTTPPPAADIVQEARRSEAEELQIAFQTNSPDALQTYLERYPTSAQRQKLTAEIARLKRSEFNEWTLYQIGNSRFPKFLKVSSIRQYGDRVAVQTRQLFDPSAEPLQKYPEGSFQEATVVLDCKHSLFAIADLQILTQSGTVFARYVAGNPDILDLSKGIAIAPDGPTASLKNIVCDETVSTPTVTKKQLASMKFSNLGITPDVEAYYQPIQREETSAGEKDAIVLLRKTKEGKIADMLPAFRGSLVELGTGKTFVTLERFHCKERKHSALKSELYDASNELKFISGIDLTERSSALDSLQLALCGPRQVQK